MKSSLRNYQESFFRSLIRFIHAGSFRSFVVMNGLAWLGSLSVFVVGDSSKSEEIMALAMAAIVAYAKFDSHKFFEAFRNLRDFSRENLVGKAFGAIEEKRCGPAIGSGKL